MNMRWNQIAVAAAAGFLMGAFFADFYHMHLKRRPPQQQPQAEGMIENLTRELDLSSAQQGKVVAIFDKYRPQVRALKDSINPAMEDLRKKLKGELKTVLTPQQYAKLDRLDNDSKMQNARPPQENGPAMSRDDVPPPAPVERAANAAATAPRAVRREGLKLTAVAGQPDGGTLPAAYTCDGAGISPALSWTGAPKNTKEFALLMTTIAPEGVKWNWVLYGIPAKLSALSGKKAEGTPGLSHGDTVGYKPPCSRGPGPKQYTFTLYALSAQPSIIKSARPLPGDAVTAAIAPLTISSSAVTLTYTRPGK
jgi:phosphatidylethanolamine-binding protein (PEBP) family uncharacterized protein/Spy/CpxP family protein refolding chaperone